MNAKLFILVGALLAGTAGMFQAQRIRQLADQLGDKWTRLHPELQRRVAAVIADLAAEGIAVGIPGTGGWRSIQNQDDIPDANTGVRDPLDSYHVWGLAVDLVPLNAAGRVHWPDASDTVWQRIGAVGKAHGLEWGGDFQRLFDGPHLQLPVPLWEVRRHYSDPLAFVNEHAADPGLPRLA